MRDRPKDQGAGILKSMREFLLGFTGYEHSVTALKQKAALDNLMTLIFFGDLIGLPIIKPYYALRMLPHVFPRLEGWKRSMMRQRDWSDWSFD
jgi:hypothetical protein